jgi:hypothetical protein
MDEERVLTLEQEHAKMKTREADRDEKLEAIYSYITQQRTQSLLNPTTPILHTKVPKTS